MKHLIAAGLLALSTLSHAADISPAKQKLIDRVLQLQRPAVENYGRMTAEQPAVQVMQTVGQLLQTRVPPEKREALAKDVQSDLRKYTDEAVPLLRERAVKLMPTTLGAVLATQFTEAELKQLVAAMEAPAVLKFQQSNGDMMRSLSEKLAAEVRPELETKLRALQQTIGKRFEAAIGTPPAAGPGPSSGPGPTSKP